MRGGVDDLLRGVQSQSRQYVDFSRRNLDDTGARKVATLLATNKVVKRLNLAWNEVWADGAQHLAHAVATNSTLEELDLSHNSIQSTGAVEFADALKMNTTLRILNLCDNNITDDGIKALLHALDYNTTLQKLEFNGNPIFDKELKFIIEEKLNSNSLKRNEIVVQNNSPQTSDMISKLTKQNEELKAQNRNSIKRLEKVTNEHNTLKETCSLQEANLKESKEELNLSIQEQISLEKKLADISTKLEREKIKVNEIVTVEKQHGLVIKENEEMKERLTVVNNERRIARQQYEALVKRVALFTGDKSVYDTVDMDMLSTLESQLEDSLRALRTSRVQRLQRKLDEATDHKKCKVCFEGSVNVLLIPCNHHILCTVCSEKVNKCPICNTQIQKRLHTYSC